MWDKKGENLTYKFFKLLAEQNRPKLAVIIGDSQTYHSGGALGKILKDSGYEVIKNYKAGENTNKTIQRLSKINLNKPVSLVVIFTGGNNPNVDFSKTATANLIKLIRRKFGQDVEIIIGTAPPARTGDPARVKKVFGRTAHPEAYKAKRRAMADAIVSTANSLDIKAVNPHTAGFLDDDINTGDGIHLTGSDAQNFAEAIASQISGKVNIQTPISAVIKDFSGKRLATDKLKGLDLVELARYAQSRATKCQGMDYLTINSKGDKVKQIQNKLTNLGFNPPNKDEEAYGTFDLRTRYNVLAFQKISNIRTDGCVGPETINALGSKDEKSTILTTAGMEEKEFAKKYNLDTNILAAFVAMESGGKGFAPADPAAPEKGKRMLIRFEPHVFVRLIMKKGLDPNKVPYYVAPPNNNQEAEKLAKEFSVSEAKVKQLVGLPLKRAIKYGVWSLIQRKNSSRKGFRKSGQGVARLNFREWEGLNNALKIDEDAAYKSISMGSGQVMGHNYRKLGYSTAKDMFNALSDQSDTGKLKQKEAKLKFIENSPRLMRAIREKEWEMIGKLYNGSRQYGKKLEKVYNRMAA